MATRLEEWSFFDHVRFLGRASVWLVGAMLVAGGISWNIAARKSVSQAELLLQLGYNPISGWLEPPAEIVARTASAIFLADLKDGRPQGNIPNVVARQLPKSGFVRLTATGVQEATVKWAVEASAQRIIEEHGKRAARAEIALGRRATQIDRDIERMISVLALPSDSSPELVTERLRLVQRLGAAERERDDLRPEVKIASPRRTIQVQPLTMRTTRKGAKQAIYGGTAGFLLALTLVYLREGLRARTQSAQSDPNVIERT